MRWLPSQRVVQLYELDLSYVSNMKFPACVNKNKVSLGLSASIPNRYSPYAAEIPKKSLRNIKEGLHNTFSSEA